MSESGRQALDERILEATTRLLLAFGRSKTSMADVAREAGIARGTLYRHFPSREALFDAHMLSSSDRFYRDVVEAMEGKATLTEQLGEFSRMIIEYTHMGPANQVANGENHSWLVGAHGVNALKRISRLLVPFVEKARFRGEVREDLDIADASQWLARILMSFTVFHISLDYQPGDAEYVRAFTERYVLRGLAD